MEKIILILGTFLIFSIAIAQEQGFVNFDQFSKALTTNNYTAPSQEQYNNFNNNTRSKGNITSLEEAAMCLAQLLHESGGLVKKKETECQKPENLNCPKSYRTPGCDADNQYYYGRGYIQLTGCYNYGNASNALFNDTRLVTNPSSVADDDAIAWGASFWYWSAMVHNQPGVQQGKFGATTKAINGSKECSAPGHETPPIRFRIYGKVRSAFGLPGDGDSSGCS